MGWHLNCPLAECLWWHATSFATGYVWIIYPGTPSANIFIIESVRVWHESETGDKTCSILAKDYPEK
jgi:hypothetical protein